MNTVLIRADADASIGVGHVMRMFALAETCVERGIRVLWVFASCPESILERWQKLGVAMHPIELEGEKPGGASDQQKTLEIAGRAMADWVVLDGYGFGFDYQAAMHLAGHRVMVMDDFVHCDRWFADLIVRVGFDSPPPETYRNERQLWSLLGGSQYALIRRELRLDVTRPRMKSGSMGTKNLLATFGGSDPAGVSEQLLLLWNRAGFEEWRLRLIVGSGNPRLDVLEKQARENPLTVELVMDPENMADHYAWADAVVTAVGGTTWEWLHWGLAALVVPVAYNQVALADELCRRNLARRAGTWDDGKALLDWNGLQACLGRLDSWKEATAATEIKPEVDGLGARRVVDAMEGMVAGLK
jgi:UDP-2,4-diacetamido-2,4,6-trideoxy-beta-L-altropyranose hydrolase